MRRRFLAIMLATALTGAAGVRGQDAAAWTEKDTALANHYLAALQASPEYGNVLDLLWNLYDAKGQSAFLVDHFRAMAAADGAPAEASTILGHLLRKAGDLGGAAAAYEMAGAFPAALRARAELASAEGDHAAAADRLGELAALFENDAARRGGILMDLGRARLLAGERDAAFAAWKAALSLLPDDFASHQEAAEQMMHAGEFAEAAAIYEKLAERPEPDAQIEALRELARIREAAGEFAPAAAALRRGLALIHFKHELHDEFLRRLVRLYEGAGKLGDLEMELLAAAESSPPGEAALFAMAEFYGLTADPERRVEWLRKLIAFAPGAEEYRRALAESLAAQDRYAEAGEAIDALLAEKSEPSLVFQRCAIDLASGAPDQAAARLEKLLGEHPADAGLRKAVLEFARGNYLHALTERLLTEAQKAEPHNEERAIALATWLLERQRLADAKQLLGAYCDAEPEPARSAERALKASRLLRSHDQWAAAGAFARRALEAGGTREAALAMGEALAAQGDEAAAAKQFERAWQLSADPEQRLEVDERLFAILQGGPLAGENEEGAPSEEPSGTEPEAEDAPERVIPASKAATEFFAQAAVAAEAGGGRVAYWRAGWWAYRLGAYPRAYELLHKALEAGAGAADPEQAKADEQELNKLLLDLAMATKNHGLAQRQLDALAAADPKNRAAYLRRKAEIDIARQMPEQALEILRALAGEGGHEPGTLADIAQAMARAGDESQALALWGEAYEAGDTADRRQLLRPFATALAKSGALADALALYTAAIADEGDLRRRRELLSDQFALIGASLANAPAKIILADLAKAYASLSAQRPFDPFLQEARGKALEVLGDGRGAFEAMRRAYYLRPARDEKVLHQLRDLARSCGEAKAAAYFQRQLIESSDQAAGFDEWMGLVRMLEGDLLTGEADRLRARLIRKFGQDPEALGSLLDQFTLMRDARSAANVYAQKARLTPPPAREALAVAMLCLEEGEGALARGLLDGVIEQTGKHPPAPFTPDHFPLEPDRLDSHSAPIWMARAMINLTGHPVEAMDAAALYFEKPRAAFAKLPVEDEAVRLRAIEERAKLAADGDAAGQAQWVSRWMARSAEAPLESLWALHYAKASHAAAAVLFAQGMPDPGLGDGDPGKALAGQLAFAAMALMEGAAEPLIAWVEDAPGGEAREDRRAIALSAIRLHVFAPDGARADPDSIRQLCAAGIASPREAWTLAALFSGEGQYAHALAAGEFAAEEPGGGYRPHEALSLASWAQFLDQSDAVHRYLWATVEASAHPQFAINDAFYDAFTRLYDIEDGAGRARLADLARERADSLPFDNERAFRLAFIAATTGDLPSARQHLRRMIEDGSTLGSAPASRRTQLVAPAPDARFWFDLTEDADFLRRHGFAALGDYLLRTFEGRFGELPAQAASLEDPEDLAMARAIHLTWQIAPLSYPERQRRVRAHLAAEPNRELELAACGVLENAGFYRECVPIYREMLEAEPGSADYCELFLEACRRAYEPEAALGYFDQVEPRGSMEMPEGFTLRIMADRFARFLLLAGDREQLESYAFAPVDHPFSWGKSGTSEFLNAVIRDSRERGDEPAHERALRRAIDQGIAADKETWLALAQCLARQEKFAEAAAALDAVPRDALQQRVATDAAAAAERAWVAAQLGDRTAAEASALAAAKKPPDAATIRAAEALALVGEGEKALGLIDLALRRVAPDGLRADLLLARARLAAETGAGDPLPALRAFLAQGPVAADLRRAFADLIAAHAAERGDAFANLLAEALAMPGKRADLAALGAAALHPHHPCADLAAAAARRTASDRRVEAHELAALTEALVDAKLPRIARALWEESAIPMRLRLKPLHLRIAAALGDGRAIESAFHRAATNRYPGAAFGTRMPAAFAEAGRPDLAEQLFRHYLQQADACAARYPALVHRYADFLLQANRPADARHLLLTHGSGLTNTPSGANLLGRAFGGVSGQALDDALAPYHLTRAIKSAVRRAAAEGAIMPSDVAEDPSDPE